MTAADDEYSDPFATQAGDIPAKSNTQPTDSAPDDRNLSGAVTIDKSERLSASDRGDSYRSTIGAEKANQAVASWPSVPGFEIVGLLGHGGMGVVYKGRQLALNRFVALKMVRDAEYAAPEQLARFKTEAETVARLQHPNIVQIFEIGEHAGRPFFALEFVEGGNLAQKINGTPLQPKEAARLVEIVARAIHAAHEKGVLHRDLKPGNILLMADGTPKVSDFGLAKKLEEGAGQTLSGAILGTPTYMAPEQARGKTKFFGPATDVYGLGAILYELLTGRPPFKGASPMDTVMQVITDDPVSPKLLQKKLSRDLETVCLKCLEKDPRMRYATASALAEDLARFLRGEAMYIRPVGRLERGIKWVRRMGGVYWKWRNGDSGILTFKDHTNAVLSVAFSPDGKRLASGSGDNTVKVGNADPGQQVMTLKGHADSISRVAFSPDGKRLASGSWDTTVKIWNADSGKKIQTINGHANWVMNVAFTPDGKRLASGSKDRTVKIWNADTGREVLTLNGHTNMVSCVAFSPDGKRLASGSQDNTVKVWRADSGQEVLTFNGHSDGVFSVAFSPDGKHLASGSEDRTIKVWNIDAGQEILTLKGHRDAVYSVIFSPDGERLASASRDKSVKVWNAGKGQEVLTLKGHKKGVTSVSFSPDGKLLASGSFDKTVKVWDTSCGQKYIRTQSR